mmetsp:Transcript_21566/g.53177  ORF Transcript_21566/g.53177 Transcript_21566/m.53177 type:complete len:143 (-) Transcript_21566:252-680(-)
MSLVQRSFFDRQVEPGLASGEEIGSRLLVVALERESFLEPHIFLTYLGPDHGANDLFEAVQRESDAVDTVTLNWDMHGEASEPLEDLISMAISRRFFQQCSLALQEKWRNNGRSLWPGGVVTSPLALSVTITALRRPVHRLV